MDPAAHIGAVHLTIADLARSIRFYESRLGFTLRAQDDRTAWLGAGGADLLILSQSEHAPRARGTTGLYHFAILTPSRANLARSLRRLVATRTPLTGASDHGVSEALYLNDPDGNGIEIYRDRPRREWPFVGGRVNMGLDPLDLAALLADAADDDGGLAEGTIIGHMHLRVARIDEAERFYVGVLGFDLMQRFDTSASFVSAGGYHHHIGLNTWGGVGAPPPPAGALGLKEFVVEVPDGRAVDAIAARLASANVSFDRDGDTLAVLDPSRNAIKFQPAGAGPRPRVT